MTDAPVATKRPAHPNVSTILVLGVMSLLCPQLPVFGPTAWFFGNRLLATYDAHPGKWGSRGLVEAGRVLGMIGSALTGLLLLLVIGLVALRPR